MLDYIPELTIQSVKALSKEDGLVRKFLERYAIGSRSPKTLDVSTIANNLSISREEANYVAKKVANAGFGTYYVGRRGFETRLEFDEKEKLVPLSQEVLRETIETEVLKINLATDLVPQSHTSENNELNLTIPEAKMALARSLGVDPSNIEITIKY